ncbi:zinc finger CCCH domain-containing protein 13-like isoform X3 [Lineus longissimus]|uniref:zinc finger CCCH domain-containing protein 13-like isoform X3 n=1 Tax=Lineus longissimus TaxID=88925 RepID=UPI00315DC2B0
MTSKQNGGYRSPSGKSHNRSRTRSYDSYDDYTDSFESDTEVDLKKSGTSSKTFNKKKPAGTGTTTTSNRKPANSRARNIKPTPKGKGQKNGRGSVQVASPRDMDAVSKRMLSARRLKINELRNQVEELNLLVQDLKLENRTMKRDFRRQDKALSRYEVQESELPSLIAQHSEEVRTLRDQIKRSKEKYENSNKRYKDLSEELHKTKKLLKQYKDLAEHKKLGERDELARKLTQTEVEMDEKDKKIRDLERYIDNLQKNQRHELAIEIHRHRETQRRVAHYEDMIQGLETQIKEKEKILDIKNIYSHRIVRPPHKLPSGASTPLSMKRSKRSSLSDHRLTPREKVKQYEEKRREDDRKQREDSFLDLQTPRTVSAISTQTTPPPPAKTQEELNSRSTTPSPPSVKSESDGEDVERERQKGELIKRNQEYSSRNSIAHDEVEEEARDSAEWQYRKDKERWDAEEEEKRRRAAELDEARRKDRQMQEARERERLEEREKLGRERAEEEMRRKREREEEEQREREEREKWEREERERREREDRERVEEERRYRDERERREREERERREEERACKERERMEKDAQFQEERRKKDALLAKLRALDENDSDNQSNLYKQNKPVEKMKSERTNISSSSSKKSYAFTKPIENLHQGKPSHEDNSIPYIEKRRRSGFVDEDVPYQPSFDDSNANNQQAKKKADLMKNLFGDSAVTSTSKKTEPTKRGVDRPEVDDLDGGNEFFMTKSNRQPSKDADLAFTFSSGNNRGRNENGSSDSKLLPRRQSQQPTTITKPTVSLIDDPDDLEEVIL